MAPANASAAVAASGPTRSTKPAPNRWLPITSDALLRTAVDNARHATAPASLLDVTLFTDDALDREIGLARMRIGDRATSSSSSDGDRLFLTRLEDEQRTRATPRSVDPRTLPTLAEVDAVTKMEATFLARFGGRLAPAVLAEHHARLARLEGRRAELLFADHACNNARPTFVPATELPHGAHAVVVTADDVIRSLATKVTLSPLDQAQVRATFDGWRNAACRETGHDPTHLAARESYAEAKIDRRAYEVEALEKQLEMLETIRESAFATLAFLESCARHEPIETAHARVMMAKTVSDVALAVPPTAIDAARGSSKRPSSTEVDGRARSLADERLGRGHAQNTRFRGVDNTKWERDLDKITYGPWRPNEHGKVRTVEEARALFERQTGAKIPAWVKIEASARVPDGSDAHYRILPDRAPGRRDDRVVDVSHFERGVVVHVSDRVFGSDEAIVAVLRHEIYELENLHRKVEDAGTMTGADLHLHVVDRRPKNLHCQAWDVADIEVRIMRAPKGGPEHAKLLELREALLERFETQNHGLH